MRSFIVGVLAVLLISVSVCMVSAQEKVVSSNDAIEASKTMGTIAEKTQYLLAQANTLYSSKEFQGTVDVAQYILKYLDSENQTAKDLLEKAKLALADAAKAGLDDAKNSLMGLGN